MKTLPFDKCILPLLKYNGKNISLDPSIVKTFNSGYFFNAADLSKIYNLDSLLNYTVLIKAKDTFKKIISIETDYAPQEHDLIIFTYFEGKEIVHNKMYIFADGECSFVDMLSPYFSKEMFSHDYIVKWWTSKEAIVTKIKEYESNLVKPIWLYDSKNV